MTTEPILLTTETTSGIAVEGKSLNRFGESAEVMVARLKKQLTLQRPQFAFLDDSAKSAAPSPVVTSSPAILTISEKIVDHNSVDISAPSTKPKLSDTVDKQSSPMKKEKEYLLSSKSDVISVLSPMPTAQSFNPERSKISNDSLPRTEIEAAKKMSMAKPTVEIVKTAQQTSTKLPDLPQVPPELKGSDTTAVL